jgi:very-short-patch-repair endonuclease
MADLQPMTSRDALRLEETRWSLSKAPWTRPHHGVVAPDHLDPDDPLVRVQHALPILSAGSVLTGWASARWQGNVMLDGQGPSGQKVPVTLASPDGGQHRNRPGIRATRRSMLPDETLIFDGVPVTTLARAVYDQALDARSLRETVVTIDMGASRVVPQARTTLANIHRLVERHHKTRGIVRVRKALALATDRSASPWETRTRLLAVLDADLNGLRQNTPVFDLASGLLGVADLIDPETGLVIESDGSHHREAEQHTDDNRREERFERANAVVCRVTALDHKDRWETVRRIRAAYRDAARLTDRFWTLEKPDWWWDWEPGRRWD